MKRNSKYYITILIVFMLILTVNAIAKVYPKVLTAHSSTVQIPSKTSSINYPIVDTGQTTCYDNNSAISAPSPDKDFYGQDAQINGNQPSYTDNDDGTITDNVTGLMWQQSADWDKDGDIDAADKLTYAEATAGADDFELAGYTDWRLPTIKELYSLIMFTGEDPSGWNGTDTDQLIPFINTDYFQRAFGDLDAGDRIIDSQFATSTLYVSTTMNGNETMFGVNMVDGRIKGYPTGPMPGQTEGKGFYVLYVRGNTRYGINDYKDNNDGTITDIATGLMWQQNDSETGMNWQDALAWTQNKNSENFLGYNDWRLPNAKELHSIIDYTRAPATTNSAAIDPLFSCSEITDEGGSKNWPFYWSSTTHANMRNGGNAAYLCFGEALGWMTGPSGGNYTLMDVHGAGAQRSDPKDGDPNDYPYGHGPQGDVIRVYNYVRLVRDAEIDTTTTGGGDDDDPLPIEGEATLFAPLGSTTTYLIDSEGENINTWQSDYRPGNAVYLLSDKSLLRTASVGRNGNTTFGATGGAGGIVERYDWDGNKIWEFEHNSDDYLLHHDIEYLPNGNILMIAWECKTSDEAITEGRNPAYLDDGELWPDMVIEVKPEGTSGGTIVWEWHVWDHLVQNFDPSKDNYGVISENSCKIDINFYLQNMGGKAGADWNHINAVDYNAELDQILLTCHNFSEIWIIDHNTTTEEAAGSKGDLLYRWGNPQTYDRGSSSDQQLFVPHDGHWISEECPGSGDILIFNNGQGRLDGNYSSVEQISPPVTDFGEYNLNPGSAFAPDAPGWNYIAEDKTSFFATNISGAQRLPDGNTLICDGPAGTFFEVTPEGETVWEYVNPYTTTNPQGETMNNVFRAVRYYLDDEIDTDIVNTMDISKIPQENFLEQNYPNPFNPQTTIRLYLPAAQNASVIIFNSNGQQVTTLVSETIGAGWHEYQWQAGNNASGIYFYTLVVDGQRIQTNKMLLMK